LNVVTRGDTPEKHVATTSSQVGFREHEKLCGLSTDKPFGITEIEAKRVLPGWCGALLYGAPLHEEWLVVRQEPSIEQRGLT
jgi:hypothetical protein